VIPSFEVAEKSAVALKLTMSGFERKGLSGRLLSSELPFECVRLWKEWLGMLEMGGQSDVPRGRAAYGTFGFRRCQSE
jgi:hypothetical protein